MEADDGIVHADSAYTGDAIETILEAHGVTGEICEKGYWNHPLTTAQKKRNRKKEHDQGLCGAYVRVHDEYDERRVEHEMDRDARSTAGIGLLNLVYTLARYEQILR